MSKVAYPLIDGWIGYGDGASALVATGTPLDADHPLVLERPELFEFRDEKSAFNGASPVRRGRRPAGASNGGEADG